MSDALERIARDIKKPHHVIPFNATPFSAVNAAVLTADATGVALVGGEAVAGKRHWVTQAVVINMTTAEACAVDIRDEDDVVAAVLRAAAPSNATLPGVNDGNYVFDPPLEIAAGKAVQGSLRVATGDAYLTVVGYVEA